MKNKYLLGLLTGILCTALLLGITFTGYNILGNNNGNTNNFTQGADNSNDNEATSATINSELQRKLNLIKGLVSNYYLGEVTEEQYQTGMLKGLMEALDDPYSCYYTKEEYASLMESSSGIYCGIGAYVSQNVTTGIITIVKPFVDGPAYNAGILPGDTIYKVNGEEVTGTDLTKVVGNMKGEEGTEVTVTIVREGEKEPVDYVIKRGTVEVPTIAFEMLEDKIGYIYVSEFDEITVTQFKSAISELEDQGMKGLVIDVRDNPGGLLDACVKMLDRLLPKGLLVYQEDKNGTRLSENYADNKEQLDVPMAVIVNGNSASASEIFSGALQDYEKATIVGTQSFGKGIVQSVFPIGDGSAIKVTISKYFTPKGRNIHGTGIEPDKIVELDESLAKKVVIEHEEDNQLQAAIEVVKDQLNGK